MHEILPFIKSNIMFYWTRSLIYLAISLGFFFNKLNWLRDLIHHASSFVIHLMIYLNCISLFLVDVLNLIRGTKVFFEPVTKILEPVIKMNGDTEAIDEMEATNAII